jgi:rfaE bifunctional protein nucleotidyltransferase chain/domain
MKGKIKTAEEIGKIVEGLKKNGKKIVTCNGSFDILHIGHMKFLEEAKRQGDILVVGLNSDSSVKSYKGEKRPINTEENRAFALAALEIVDYVVIFSEKDPRKLLEAIKPDVHVNGEEYGKDCVEAETVKKNGGRIQIVKNFGGFSTTEMIKKIKELE